jgi:3'(2'), 5'-bisphosphate nucleotidase
LTPDHSRLVDQLAEAAREAGEAILEVVRRGFEVESKRDTSPVTEADRAAELVILAARPRVDRPPPLPFVEPCSAARERLQERL